MRKKIYTALSQRLTDDALGIRSINLWNKQLDLSAAEPALATPAVFIEFEPIAWAQSLDRVRSADLQVRLHIVTPPADGSGEPLAHLDLIERISVAVQGLSGEGFNALQRVESVTDHNHAQLHRHEECFLTRVTDTSAQRQRATVTGLTLQVQR